MKSAPDIIIWIKTNHLEDGGSTYDVVLGDLILNAVTEEDANDLAMAFEDAIMSHTTKTAGILYEG